MRCEHPALGFSLEAPEGWQAHWDQGDCAAVLVEATAHPVLTPCLTVVVEDHRGHGLPDQHDWVETAVEGLSATLDHFLLVDALDVQLRSAVATLLVANHVGPDHVSAGLLQWLVPALDHGYVITASLWTMDLPQRMGELGSCVEAFEAGQLPG